MACIQYITETKIFSTNTQTDTNANSVLFINTGADKVVIDGLLLQPSQSWSIEGNVNEILVKVYNFQFLSFNMPSLTVIYKRYVNAS
jgi:hypothetical protein